MFLAGLYIGYFYFSEGCWRGGGGEAGGGLTNHRIFYLCGILYYSDKSRLTLKLMIIVSYKSVFVPKFINITIP